MTNAHWPIEEIDYQLRERVGELVEFLSGQSGVRRGNSMRFGESGGLKVDVAGTDKGRITSFYEAGKGQSPLQYIQAEVRCSFIEAVEWAANWLGISEEYRPDPELVRRRKERQERERRAAAAREREEQSKRIAIAAELAKRSHEAVGTPAGDYLRARGITAELPPDVQYLPPHGMRYGALVVVARNDDGEIVAVQRVFIHEGGKAPVDPVKRTNGVLDGAAVRLPAIRGSELVLTEGPETGLSVWQAWGRETWVALGNIAKLVDTVPVGRRVIVARDADTPDSPPDRALIKGVEAMLERGVDVHIVSPENPSKPGYDFNDVLMEHGDRAVSQALSVAGLTMPRYPAQHMSVKEARSGLRREFSAWTDALRPYWELKAIHDAHLAAITASAA